MQCRCCHSEIAEGLATCPACDYPVLTVGGGTEESRRHLEEYRAARLRKITIDLQVFSYEVRADGVSDTGSVWRPLAGASQLRHDAVFWSDLVCQKMTSDRSFTMRVRMRTGNGSKEQLVTLKPDKPVSRESVGVIAAGDFVFKLAVGNRETYILSEPIRML